MRQAMEALVISALALLVAAALIAVFFAATGNSPLAVFHTLYRGAFGTWFSWQNTLVRAAPLMLTALCTALPARAGLIVIGGEGAMVVGGLTATMTALALAVHGPALVLPAMIAAAVASGGLWVAAVGALRHYRGVNETISSLLLNYIAIAILNFLVFGVLRDPATLNKPSTHAIGEANMIGAIGDSSVHWGLVWALIICVLLSLYARRSIWGFALDVVGGNPRAARLAGLPVGRYIMLSCFLGGAAAGIGGMLEVAAVQGRANISLATGYGYAGILVAFLARHNPLAIIPVALLLAGIRASGGLLQRSHDLPDATVLVIQGTLFVVILASELCYGRLPQGLSHTQAATAHP
jgi:simple sugar transport system permease protein